MHSKKTLKKLLIRPLVEDGKISKLLCTKCGLICLDQEPMGHTEFWHKEDPKRYCPNQNKLLMPGMIGVAVFRRKCDRRARTRGARTAWKTTQKNK